MTIRRATADDTDWIRALIPRLHEFGPPPFRDVGVMDAAEADATVAAATAPTEDRAVFVATDGSGSRVGFVHLETTVDFFTHERHGHISTLVVAPDAERRGAGQALLAAAEDWTRRCGYRFLTLNVFEANQGARRLYERAGFRIDTIKYLKIV